MAQRLPGAIAAALSRHPEATYVIAPFDSNGFFANEGVRQAGRIGQVKVASYEGDPQTIAAIRDGQYAMTIADPAEWMGWQATDELVRAFANSRAVQRACGVEAHRAGQRSEHARLVRRCRLPRRVQASLGRQMSGAPALVVRGARKAFGGVRALAGVDLEIRPGEIHALLGENGAGKSTLIKILAGVLSCRTPASSQSMVARCRAASRPRDAAGAGLRFVHQDFGLIDTMSVLENIAFVAGFRETRRAH